MQLALCIIKDSFMDIYSLRIIGNLNSSDMLRNESIGLVLFLFFFPLMRLIQNQIIKI